MPRIYSRSAGHVSTFDEDDIDEALEASTERAPSIGARHAVRATTDAMLERYELERGEIEPTKWVNPSNLDAPRPRDGYVQRWIRDGIGNESDNLNWMRKMREGWSPRDPATIPPAERNLYPSAKLANGLDVIRVAGLVLCEMPRQVAMQRRLAVEDSIKRQRAALPDSVEQLSKQERSLGPVKVEEETRVVRGRQPATMVE